MRLLHIYLAANLHFFTVLCILLIVIFFTICIIHVAHLYDYFNSFACVYIVTASFFSSYRKCDIINSLIHNWQDYVISNI